MQFKTYDDLIKDLKGELAHSREYLQLQQEKLAKLAPQDMLDALSVGGLYRNAARYAVYHHLLALLEEKVSAAEPRVRLTMAWRLIAGQMVNTPSANLDHPAEGVTKGEEVAAYNDLVRKFQGVV